MTEILFTTTSTPGSVLIRKITGEPVSHCAIRFDDLVVHAAIGGVQVNSYEKFAAEHVIALRVSLSEGDIQKTAPYLGDRYDYGALLFLGVRYILKSIGLPTPKVNLWQSANMYICTEFVTSDILNKEDTTITPYQLYLKLLGDKK